jgi:Ankyrin repeat
MIYLVKVGYLWVCILMSKCVVKPNLKVTDSKVESYKNAQKLIILLKTKHFEEAEKLSWKGIDASCVDESGNSALHLAVKFKQTNIVSTLLLCGADSYLKNKAGLTPLDLVKKDSEIKDLILCDRKCPGNFDKSDKDFEEESSPSFCAKFNFGHFVSVLGAQDNSEYLLLEEDE